MRIRYTKKRFLIEQESEITNQTQSNSISGFDKVIEKITSKGQYTEEQINKIKDFIRKSGVVDLEITPIRNAAGIALDNKVIISPQVFEYPITRLLYILFHEVAHAYQFKKYGKTEKWNMYFNEQPVEESAKFMKYLENIADEFAIRKLRELANLGLITKLDAKLIYPVYSSTPLNYFIKFIEFFREKISNAGITDRQQINELLYRYAVIGNMEILKQYRQN